MTYREAYVRGESVLREQGFAEASTDAWLLFEYASGMDRTHYFLFMNEECPQQVWESYRALVKRRLAHVPIQYLTGTQEFMGYSFQVNQDVLIPRPETELLVLEAEKCLRKVAGRIPRVLDMCTGSGCIITSLAKRMTIEAVGADVSAGALKVAAKNAQALDVRVEWIMSDLFCRIEGSFDCIVSNPPYIRSEEIAGLMPEVRDFEPRLALDGHGDGLYFYRRIIEDSRAHLNTGGWLLFEIGCDQGADVAEQMRAAGYGDICIVKDMAGLDRIAKAKYLYGGKYV